MQEDFKIPLSDKIAYVVKADLTSVTEIAVTRTLVVPRHIPLRRLGSLIELTFGWNERSAVRYYGDGGMFPKKRFFEMQNGSVAGNGDSSFPSDMYIQLGEVLCSIGDAMRFRTVDGYGSAWDHRLSLQFVYLPRDEEKVPRVAAGCGATPVEDLELLYSWGAVGKDEATCVREAEHLVAELTNAQFGLQDRRGPGMYDEVIRALRATDHRLHKRLVGLVRPLDELTKFDAEVANRELFGRRDGA